MNLKRNRNPLKICAQINATKRVEQKNAQDEMASSARPAASQQLGEPKGWRTKGGGNIYIYISTLFLF